MLNIKDLKVGDRLKLINEAMKDSDKLFNLDWVDFMRSQNSIVVTGFDSGDVCINDNEDFCISSESIAYFEKLDERKFKAGDKIKYSDYDKSDILTVKELNDKSERYVFEDDTYVLYSNEDDYEAAEQSQYTFDDLIDVAAQANKDRVINGFSVVGGVLNCQTLDGEDYNLGIGCEVAHGIEYLQSLYKETFVIETEEDLDRFNKDVEITLANDEKLSWEDLKSIGLMNTRAIFKALKGATVEQSK